MNWPMPVPIYQFWRDDREQLNCWSVTPEYKTDLLRWYGKKYKCPVFIETGTAEGDTIDGLQNDFYILCSIEIDDAYFAHAFERFKEKPHIHLYKGNSGEILGQNLVFPPETPILFWLDAHMNNISPLKQELEAIFKNRTHGVILIDDLQGFWHNNWPQIAAKVVDAAGWKRETIDGIMRVIKEP